MILRKTKNFCVSKIEICGRCFYFINELKNGKPTGHAGETAGRYYATLEQAAERLEQRQKDFDGIYERLNPLMSL